MMCGAPSATLPATTETQEIADKVRLGPGQASRTQTYGDRATQTDSGPAAGFRCYRKCDWEL